MPKVRRNRGVFASGDGTFIPRTGFSEMAPHYEEPPMTAVPQPPLFSHELPFPHELPSPLPPPFEQLHDPPPPPPPLPLPQLHPLVYHGTLGVRPTPGSIPHSNRNYNEIQTKDDITLKFNESRDLYDKGISYIKQCLGYNGYSGERPCNFILSKSFARGEGVLSVVAATYYVLPVLFTKTMLFGLSRDSHIKMRAFVLSNQRDNADYLYSFIFARPDLSVKKAVELHICNNGRQTLQNLKNRWVSAEPPRSCDMRRTVYSEWKRFVDQQQPEQRKQQKESWQRNREQARLRRQQCTPQQLEQWEQNREQKRRRQQRLVQPQRERWEQKREQARVGRQRLKQLQLEVERERNRKQALLLRQRLMQQRGQRRGLKTLADEFWNDLEYSPDDGF